jgi:site-specific DNA-methyltransferase (adenine-specific)
VEIWHGDCRDVLPHLDHPDLLLTDPPYGMAYSAPGNNNSSLNVAGDGVRQGVRLVRQMLVAGEHLWGDDLHVLMFCHWESWPDFYDACATHFSMRNALIWHKAASSMGALHRDYARTYEVVLYGGRGERPLYQPDTFDPVLTFGKVAHQHRQHLTEKPVPLLGSLIRRHTSPGALVLDPFMGSGATLVAALKEGRRAVGVELSERYCEVAATRLAQRVLELEWTGTDA